MGRLINREKVMQGLQDIKTYLHCQAIEASINKNDFAREGFNESQKDIEDALALLKEQEGLLGIQQTADSITFVSTGTAQQGESRGLLLGKLAMHEWLKKELLYRGLLTDEIRAVFDEAKRQEGR